MNKNTAVICEPATLRRACIHFWVIGSVNGPVSIGICRHCGAAREFKNYPNECVIQYNPFRELLGESGQDEPKWACIIETEYLDMTAAGKEEDEYEKEPDALCTVA